MESLAEWQKRFDAYLNAKPGGKAQWSRLVFGANPALLMLVSAEITANSPQGLELHRDELRAFRKELKVGIAKVLATAGLVETLNAQVSSRHADLTQFAELPQMLRNYAHYLDGYAKAASKLSSKRLPGTRDYSLFFLHSYLVKLTGRPRWRYLATLLEASYAGHGIVKEVDEEGLRKLVNGLRARDPRQCARLELKAAEYVGQGNGGWPSQEELKQLAQDVADQILHERHPELKDPK